MLESAEIIEPRMAFLWLLLKPLKWLWGLFMTPAVLFGSPNMYLCSREPKDVSWWYVPVYLKPSWFAKTIPNATVRLVWLSGNSETAISLRWYSRDSDIGVSELTLTKKRQYLIPVVYRKEGEEFAYITNENWLLKKHPEKKWPLSAGVYDFWIEVHSRGSKWRSKHTFRVCVPGSGDSNGRFILNVHYENIY